MIGYAFVAIRRFIRSVLVSAAPLMLVIFAVDIHSCWHFPSPGTPGLKLRRRGES